MITRIQITGFKSFHNFEMKFTPFTVVAGANASGKSNLFDALRLLSRLAETDNLKRAFSEQRGEFIELFTQYDNGEYAREIFFLVDMLVNRKVKDAWGNETELKYTRLRYELKIQRYTNQFDIEDIRVVYEQLEKIAHLEDEWLKQVVDNEYQNDWRPPVFVGRRSKPYIETSTENAILTVAVRQDGGGGRKRNIPLNNATRTVMSSIDTVDYPHVLAAKEEMRTWKFLQLNPADLRKGTSKTNGGGFITQSGANLAAVLYRIKQKDPYSLNEISRRLNSFLPNFTAVDVIDDKEAKQFLIQLKESNGRIFSSRVLSEGTLRILTLCILEEDDEHTGLLCFEEPENGIHPFRIETMLELLKDLSIDFSDVDMPLRQVIVNTHSPVLVGKLRRWADDKKVIVWYSKMRTTTLEINNERTTLNISKINFVYKHPQLPFSEHENKFTIAIAEKYLSTADFQET